MIYFPEVHHDPHVALFHFVNIILLLTGTPVEKPTVQQDRSERRTRQAALHAVLDELSDTDDDLSSSASSTEDELSSSESSSESDDGDEDEATTVEEGSSSSESESSSEREESAVSEAPPGSRRRVVKQVRFLELVHETPSAERTDKERITDAKKAIAKQLKSGNVKEHEEGIRGLTALRDLPNFRETWSNLSDLLHVICEGIGQRMFLPMVNDCGEPHTFREQGQADFDHQLMLQRSVRGISELDHITGPMDKLKTWKALDYFNFLLIEVGLLCCDEDVIQDSEYYELWVLLANTVYLMYDGNLTDSKLADMKGYLESFSSKYKKVMGDWQCVIKFHLFQHFARFIELHGPAFLWDAFGFERQLGMLKRDVTTTRHYLSQIGRNFLLRYFSDPFLKLARLEPRIEGFLKKLNVDHVNSSMSDLTVVPLTTLDGEEAEVPENIAGVFLAKALRKWPNVTVDEYNSWQKERVTRLRW
jgi:hypothetical protein